MNYRFHFISNTNLIRYNYTRGNCLGGCLHIKAIPFTESATRGVDFIKNEHPATSRTNHLLYF